MRNVLWIGFGLLLAACASGPKKQLTLDEIKQLAKVDELMKVQAQNADPLFKKAKSGSAWTDADWAMVADSAARLDASSARVKALSRGMQWDEFAGQVNAGSVALGQAAQAKDGAAAKTALDGMKAACKSCHSKYR